MPSDHSEIAISPPDSEEERVEEDDIDSVEIEMSSEHSKITKIAASPSSSATSPPSSLFPSASEDTEEDEAFISPAIKGSALKLQLIPKRMTRSRSPLIKGNALQVQPIPKTSTPYTPTKGITRTRSRSTQSTASLNSSMDSDAFISPAIKGNALKVQPIPERVTRSSSKESLSRSKRAVRGRK